MPRPTQDFLDRLAYGLAALTWLSTGADAALPRYQHPGQGAAPLLEPDPTLVCPASRVAVTSPELV